MRVIWPATKAEYFLREGLDHPNQLDLPWKIEVLAQRPRTSFRGSRGKHPKSILQQSMRLDGFSDVQLHI
jgi:hypothetical protein